MAKIYKRKFSRENNEWLYGYDLGHDPYLSARYIVTVGLDLEGLSPNESMVRLYEFRGEIYRFKSKRDFLRVFDTKVDGPLNH